MSLGNRNLAGLSWVNGRLGRAISLFTASIVLCSSSALGIEAAGSAAASAFHLLLQRRPGPYTELPRPVYRGPHPDRDPVFQAGRFTPRTLADLRRVRASQALEAELWECAAKPRFGLGGAVENLLWASLEAAPALLQGSGGGDEGGGDPPPGGGGGPGGGPPGSGGGSSGDGGVGTGQTGGGPGAGVNTQNGNRNAKVILVGWPSRGDSGVALVHYHNSLSDWNGDLGQSWSHTYEMKVDHTPGSSAIVRWGDGSNIAYTESPTNVFTPPAGYYESLVHNPDSTWTVTTKRQTVYRFNSTGWLTSIQDRSGNTVTVNRDASHKITSVVDPNLRQLTFTWGATGKISSISDPASRTWTFTQNASSDLTQISYPALGGNTYSRAYAYDANHNITSETDLRGKTWTYALYLPLTRSYRPSDQGGTKIGAEGRDEPGLTVSAFETLGRR